MVPEERIDTSNLKIIQWVKKRNNNNPVKCIGNTSFFIKKMMNENPEAKDLFVSDIKKPNQIPTEFENKMYLTSVNLTFYEVYDVLEKLTDVFKIFHIGKVLVAEVTNDGRRKETK